MQNLDFHSIEKYLSSNFIGYEGPSEFTKFSTGQSNPTYLINAKSGNYVLRSKPPGILLKSAHAVEREYFVIKALQSSNIPLPKPFILCENENVAGSIFFVMSFVEGRNYSDPKLTSLTNEERSKLYDHMNQVLSLIHNIDIYKSGLEGFGKPGNYFERQISRWTKQYQSSEIETISEMNQLIKWLEVNTPLDDGRVSLVHGDYRIDNFIIDNNQPIIKAVLDWELSTIGHPLADLSYQCMQWRMPEGKVGRGLAGINRKKLGIPSEKEYLELYCQRTGIDEIRNWSFYLAFSCFRFAAILQGVLKRSIEGNASNPEEAKKLGKMVPELSKMAIKIIEKN